jgi:carbon monoxide dehydrogenase subunit G
MGLTMVAASAARAADYVVVTQEVEVDRPVEAVWKLVGEYRAISEWMQTDCGYLTGDGGVGTVRRILRGAVNEVMIAQTSRSYTYLQTRGTMAFAGYHGTLAAEPIAASRTRLVYTLFYDQTVFVAEADRRNQRERLDANLQQVLDVMKTIVERSTEAPEAAPAGPTAKSGRSRASKARPA